MPGSAEITNGRLDYIPSRIALPDRNMFSVLHEVAHALESHRWWLWGNAEAPLHTEALEYERTGHHSLSFRCVALDLYYIFGAEDVGPLMELAYEPLHRLCKLYAPTYPQPELRN